METPRFQTHYSTQKSYDRLSKWYDLFTASERGIQQEVFELLDPQPGEGILEIGVGTGHLLLQIAKQVGGQGRVVGVDLSGEMTRIARSRLAKGPEIQKAYLATADALYLPFLQNSFDAVVSTFTLELFVTPEITQVLDECRRVLKPDGRLAIASLDQPPAPNRAVAIYNWFHHAFPQLVDCRPIPLKQFILTAGFEIASQKHISLWGLPAQVITGRKPLARQLAA